MICVCPGACGRLMVSWKTFSAAAGVSPFSPSCLCSSAEGASMNLPSTSGVACSAVDASSLMWFGCPLVSGSVRCQRRPSCSPGAIQKSPRWLLNQWPARTLVRGFIGHTLRSSPRTRQSLPKHKFRGSSTSLERQTMNSKQMEMELQLQKR